MPAFVIATQHCQVGQTIDAVMCDPSITGYPDRHSDVPVKATIYEQSLLIDNESRPRGIISCVGENGTTTYMVDGSTKVLCNRERRAALAKTSALLDQLRDHLLALKDEGEDFSLVVEGLWELYNFLHDERERLTAPPRARDEGNDDA